MHEQSPARPRSARAHRKKRIFPEVVRRCMDLNPASYRIARSIIVAGMLAMPVCGFSQSNSGAPLVPGEKAEMRISRQAIPELPFSVVGPRGAILGRQNGSFEAWVFPWKILTGVHLTVNMENYPVPLDVNRQAAEIDVEPDRTTITYSHANFTIRQVMLAPKTASDPAVLVLYQIEAIRPMNLTLSFTPVMQRMWPALSPDSPSPEWVKNADGSGFYILHLNFPDHAAAVAMPGAQPGILPPYQELSASWPLQFILHFDPKKDEGRSYPLLITFGNSAAEASKDAFTKELAALESRVDAISADNREYYADFLKERTGIETPDAQLNAAFSWAETAIDQLRVQTQEDPREQALTAGFIESGSSARPGFGWFFGRDALWTLYAVNSYGDFATAKQEMQFLLRHQRDDGKIMHEWSQTAGLVDWAALPYEYASADATPLLLMAANDYLKISNDRDFITSIWPGLGKAWNFEISHDTDGDGIYDNSQGSGWVESWIPSMPHQEIYLAALDEEASLAFANLARTTNHDDLANHAEQRASRIAKTIETEYYIAGTQDYAFSWNGAGERDETETIFPSVAWWDGTYGLDHSDTMLQSWAGSDISTDWGTRILSDQTWFYDPISYHQGTVWPLFTGWVSEAEYRAGHPLAGYAHLMQNVNLTWAQDPGDVTELLSGQFYQVLGRSTAHQLWSSAMVLSPILRGLFGLEWNASANTMTVTPHLPASWDQASISRIPLGNGTVNLTFRREGEELVVRVSDGAVHLASLARGATVRNGALYIPLPPVEVFIDQHLPEFGAETSQMKVLSERYGDHGLALQLSAPAGSVEKLEVRTNGSRIQPTTNDGEMGAAGSKPEALTVRFPEGKGYVDKTVTLSW
jgi:glycogen debranching enzyme